MDTPANDEQPRTAIEIEDRLLDGIAKVREQIGTWLLTDVGAASVEDLKGNIELLLLTGHAMRQTAELRVAVDPPPPPPPPNLELKEWVDEKLRTFEAKLAEAVEAGLRARSPQSEPQAAPQSAQQRLQAACSTSTGTPQSEPQAAPQSAQSPEPQASARGAIPAPNPEPAPAHPPEPQASARGAIPAPNPEPAPAHPERVLESKDEPIADALARLRAAKKHA